MTYSEIVIKGCREKLLKYSHSVIISDYIESRLKWERYTHEQLNELYRTINECCSFVDNGVTIMLHGYNREPSYYLIQQRIFPRENNNFKVKILSFEEFKEYNISLK